MFRHKMFPLRVIGLEVKSITLSRDHPFLTETAFGISNTRHKVRTY